MYDPYKYILEQSNDRKLKHIAGKESLRKKIEILLLLECEEDVKEVFGITERQLKEYKKIYFDVDQLLKEGRVFVLEYLECRGDTDLLKYYVYGEAYTKGKLGIISDLSKEDKKDLLSKALSSTIIDTLDKDPSALISAKNVEKLMKLMEEKDVTPRTGLDETLDLLIEKGILDYD